MALAGSAKIAAQFHIEIGTLVCVQNDCCGHPICVDGLRR